MISGSIGPVVTIQILPINRGQGQFTALQLPIAAQSAPSNAFFVEDFNGDGHLDVLLVGNEYGTEYRTPRADAGHDLVLLGDGTGHFNPLGIAESGIYLPGEIRDLEMIKRPGAYMILVGGMMACWRGWSGEGRARTWLFLLVGH